jgi:hypothetical protein
MDDQGSDHDFIATARDLGHDYRHRFPTDVVATEGLDQLRRKVEHADQLRQQLGVILDQCRDLLDVMVVTEVVER